MHPLPSPHDATVIGIDISKLTLDLCMRLPSGAYSYRQLPNQPAAIEEFLGSLDFTAPVLIAMENTGRYNRALYGALATVPATIFVLNPLALSKSMGLVRGKNDRIDARRICDHALANRHQLRPWTATDPALEALSVLLSERGARVKAIKALKTQRKDYASMADTSLAQQLEALNTAQTDMVKAQLKALEQLICQAIAASRPLSAQAALLCSVPGIGRVLCWHLLVKTAGFTILTEARKMACYAGVAPFERSSGTSVRGRTRVSCYADVQLKTLLHLGAMSAIRLEGSLRDYYRRKVAAGKSKMSALNAVRNKIIHRAYAVIRLGKTFTDSNFHLPIS